jgi:hypothetical protein
MNRITLYSNRIKEHLHRSSGSPYFYGLCKSIGPDDELTRKDRLIVVVAPSSAEVEHSLASASIRSKSFRQS